MRPAPDPDPPAVQPGRRALLAGSLGAVAGVLTGCNVRLEDDAPPIPFIPPREPIPAEAALMWLLRDCRDLAAGFAAAAPEPTPQSSAAETTATETADGASPTETASVAQGTPTEGTTPEGTASEGTPAEEMSAGQVDSGQVHTAEMYAEQVQVLRSALYRAGIPIDTLDAALTPPTTSPTMPPSTTPAPTTGTAPATPAVPTTAPTPDAPATDSPTTDAPATDAPTTTTSPMGIESEGPAAALHRIDELRECGPGLFPLIVSILAQRWAAVSETGGAIPASALVTDPEHTWPFPHLASGFVDLTRAAVYGMQVVAAQSREETREAAILALSEVEDLEQQQTARAAGRVQSRPIGYTLPFPVNSAQSAARLATEVLGSLIDGYGGLLTTVTGSAQSDAARDVIAWIGTAAHLAAPWGVPPAAFPGLQSAN